MTKVQSPEIGTALRTALSLDAAGGMPLEFDQTIIPVAVVTDVRELLTQSRIPVNQGGQQVAVAGNSSYTGLEWMANALPRPKRILLDSITVNSSLATGLFMGFNAGLSGSNLGLPRRKVGSLQSSSVAGRVTSEANVNAPSVVIANICGFFNLVAGTPYEIVFREPIVLDGESQWFVLGTSVQNTELRSWWQWREERA